VLNVEALEHLDGLLIEFLAPLATLLAACTPPRTTCACCEVNLLLASSVRPCIGELNGPPPSAAEGECLELLRQGVRWGGGVSLSGERHARCPSSWRISVEGRGGEKKARILKRPELVRNIPEDEHRHVLCVP
jgi:hypothetical protein